MSSLQSDDKSGKHRSKLENLHRPTRLGRYSGSKANNTVRSIVKVSVVVSLDRAGNEVRIQLLYLESALIRMRAVEADLVLPSPLNGADAQSPSNGCNWS
jgi:hypothetical protein